MLSPLHLHGCRHDILGHYLKAIGLLRVLAKCAQKEHCDPNAENCHHYQHLAPSRQRHFTDVKAD